MIEAHRQFDGIHDENASYSSEGVLITGAESAASDLHKDILGGCDSIGGPYGNKPFVYVDWTASGRAVRQLEEYLISDVMPLYGNTHTSTSISGHQSTCYRHEARQIIAEATNAKITGKASTDVVVFCGNGTTAAFSKLLLSLGLHIPLANNFQDDVSYRPVVFTSAFEHHSNLLPWREANCDVVTIAYHEVTGICLQDLKMKLAEYADRKMKIGSFSACSNVTGVLSAASSVSILMHRAGGLAIFDYASAAPYVKMDMNPVITLAAAAGAGGYAENVSHYIPDLNTKDLGLAYKDAIVFSGHKFVGGPGCPGVLVVKKHMLAPATLPPSSPGGGSVFYVTEDHQRYLSNREEREESGTPNVLGDIKVGLVLHMKQSIGVTFIEKEELRVSAYVTKALQAHSNIVLLGRPSSNWVEGEGQQPRYLPIFSFLIQCAPAGVSSSLAGKFLHYNFVCALLNDLFGIQSRGGCQCAGPFSQQLLGISPSDNHKFEMALLDKHEVLRPGYSRVSFPFFMPPVEIDFVISAILFVADHGWKFLPDYKYNPKTGGWAHASRMTKFPERKWLSKFQLKASPCSSNTMGGDSADTSPCIKAVDKHLVPNDVLSHNLKRCWNGVAEGTLLMDVVKAAKEEVTRLDKRIAKITNKKATNTSEHPENVGWFLVADDIPELLSSLKREASVEAKQGVRYGLNPFAWSQKYFPDASNANTGAMQQKAPAQEMSDGTAYAKHRSVKLAAHSGSSNSLPRYLLPVSAGGLLPDGDALTRSAAPLVSSAGQISSNKTSTVETLASSPEPMLSNTATGTINDSVSSADGLPVKPSEAVNTATLVSTESKSKKSLLLNPPKKIMKLVGQAIKDWDMIEEGDRLCLGLSGGKDSLALLHILLALQKRAPVNFTICCATVDPQTDSFDPSPLIPYVESLGVKYHYLSEPIVELAKTKLQGDSLCAFCSRFKRGLLYNCCRENKCNKLVLAQHLDDLCESFYMSLLHNGQVRTMKANYKIEAGDVRVIRPLVYVREVMTRDFSQGSSLPVINENCPACFEEPKERDRMKKLLAQEEVMVPSMFFNMRRALVPLMADETYDAMTNVLNAVEARGKNPSTRGPNGESLSVKPKQTNTKMKVNNISEATSSSSMDVEASGVDADANGGTKRKREEGESKKSDDTADADATPDGASCSTSNPFCAACYELA